jgi:hypothetical protein
MDQNNATENAASHHCLCCNVNRLIDDEPLREGEVIFYHDLIFVAGSPQGRRTTSIAKVDTSRDLVLLLDNYDALPMSHYVKGCSL